MLKEKDMLVISHLRENSRNHLTNISKKLKIPVSTLFDKLKTFEKKFIKKYTSILDFSKLGYDIRINLLMKARSTESIKKHLANNPNVNSLYMLTGMYNVLAECIFKDTASMDDFMDELSAFNIDERRLLHVVEDIKREEFLNNEVVKPGSF